MSQAATKIQVQSQPDDFFASGNGLRATGDNVMGHVSTYRILLRSQARIAVMVVLHTTCMTRPEQAATRNSTLPTICDKLNMASVHNRKLIAALVRELNQRDIITDKLEERIGLLEQRLREEESSNSVGI